MISKLLVTFVSCLIFGVGSSLFLNSCEDNLTKTAEIRAVIDTYHAALISQDDEAMNSILADSLRITRFDDSLLSKNDYLVRIRSLDGKLESVEISNVGIEIGERKATLECWTKMVFVSKWSNVVSHEAAYTYELEKFDGEWRISSIRQR